MASGKTSRWLDLVAFLLQRHYGATREEIFQRVSGYDGEPESRRRKFERDKDDLRALGIDIETISIPGAAGDEPASGYRLRPRQAYLPYLELVTATPGDRPYQGLDRVELSDDELELLDRATRAVMDQRDTPFAAAAASARRKLAFDLPLSESSVRHVLALPMPAHARQALAWLQEALMERAMVSCRYFTMSRRTEEERELEPWGLLFQWGRWYCIARARDREGPRVFRLDRMRDVKRMPGRTPHFTVPDDFDVRTFAGRAPWEFGSGAWMHAVVRFDHPESQWVVNRGVGRVIEDRHEEGAEVAFDVLDQDAFLRWVLSFGRRAAIVEPQPMVDALTALRAEVAALYEESVP